VLLPSYCFFHGKRIVAVLTNSSHTVGNG
jgi:hypothetical protein